MWLWTPPSETKPIRCTGRPALAAALAAARNLVLDRLREWDPDIIFTDWGDSYLLPLLARAQQRLSLSRDAARGMVTSAAAPRHRTVPIHELSTAKD